MLGLQFATGSISVVDLRSSGRQSYMTVYKEVPNPVPSMVQQVPRPTIARGFCVPSDVADGPCSLRWLQAQTFSKSTFSFPRQRLWEYTGFPYHPARHSMRGSPLFLPFLRRPVGMIHPYAVSQRGDQLTHGFLALRKVWCRSSGRYNFPIRQSRQVLLTYQASWFSWGSAPNLLAAAAPAIAAAVDQHFSLTDAYAQRSIAEVTDVLTDVWESHRHAQMMVCDGSCASDDPPPPRSIM
jgi:hypothetical protein